MRIMHKLIKRWYEEQGITRENCPYGGIKQYGSATFGYNSCPVCILTLHPTSDGYVELCENSNVM
jgi:hypothetical protein